MRKLIKIQLKNFQKHEDLTIEFDDNYNVISGDTASGKTCVFRALAWLCNCSNISEADYRKEGTKETSVKGWFDNGFQVERIRSNSVNRYILSTEGAEDKVFDSFGKNAPEEVQQVFGFDSIDVENEHIVLNFSDQDQLNFLIDSTYSDTFKAQLFNKLTGNEILDKVFKNLNKESLRVSREIKENEEKVEKQKSDLVDYSQQYQLCKVNLTRVRSAYTKIKEDVEIYNHLKDLAEKLSQNDSLQQETSANIKRIKIISEDKLVELKKQAEELETLKNIFNKIENVDKQFKELNDKKITVIAVDFNMLKEKINKLDQLKSLDSKLKALDVKEIDTVHNIEDIKVKITTSEQELKELWADCKVCPLCKTEVCKHE